MRRRAGWPKRLRKGSSQPQANLKPTLPIFPSSHGRRLGFLPQPSNPPKSRPFHQAASPARGSRLRIMEGASRAVQRPAGPTRGAGLTPSYGDPPPPAPPVPPLPVCCPARSGCSALLAPAGLLDVVSAPVAAPGPVVLGATSVDAGPEGAVLGDAPGGADVV